MHGYVADEVGTFSVVVVAAIIRLLRGREAGSRDCDGKFRENFTQAGLRGYGVLVGLEGEGSVITCLRLVIAGF